ncbi:hypothetical protein BAUCODRAFT_144064 [Baudoinia panamericana UAMH 10762]|uniref:Uncharacterized protein n=1 Tax=Baudoinia panamericana (strain UAMH 10762) TaxID=717646 RepID=M2NMH3_BAUPA|nr:uncharacterized protein BAUCODRAFT_144064 [Baudoinia panamericana UAMH 10762]EMD00386.1 hypothetical protein BAUCODRAFT_144064 [Baudoinia panamericana UAMH 10762]
MPDNQPSSEPELPEGWAYVTSGPDKAKHVVHFQSPQKEDTTTFKLTKGAYHAVWLYVMTGLAYPENDHRFEEIIPRGNLQTLEKHDQSAWTDMRTAIVNIHTHCKSFNDESMSTWTSMTNDVLTYVKYALSNLEGPDNFSQSLAVLVGDKYRRKSETDPEPAHDQTYKDAVEVLQDICADLKRSADGYATKCQHHIDKVESFRNTTMSDKTKVDDLDYRFNSKTDHEGKARKCYTDLINGDLATIRADEALQLSTEQSARQEYKDDVTAAATSVTYAWWFPIGTLAAIGVATAFGIKAEQAKKRMEDAERDYGKDVAKERALMTLSNWTSHMGETVHGLDTAMNEAIEAMASIKTMFEQQKSGFDMVQTELGDVTSKFNKDYNLRKRILGKFDECIKEWHTIQKLARDFLDSSSPTISGEKEPKCVGNLEKLPNEAKPPT